MFTHQGCASKAKCGSLKQIEVNEQIVHNNMIRGYLTLCVEAELCIKKHGPVICFSRRLETSLRFPV